MSDNYTTKHFENTNELRAMVTSLPNAEYKTLHKGKKVEKEEDSTEVIMPEKVKEPDFRPLTDHVGIVNKRTGELATITSNKYDLVQHREAFNPVLEALEELGLQVEGRMKVVDDGNYVNVEAIMKDQGFEVSDDSEYGSGFFFTNSYDTSGSIKASAFFERMVCSNGMRIEDNVISPMKRKHVGNIDLVERYKAWFKKLLNESEALYDRLQEIRGEFIHFERAMKNVGVPDSKAEQLIKPKIQTWKGDRASRKELYDAMTNAITHEMDDLAPSTQDRYHSRAEQVLFGNRQRLEKEVEVE